MKSIIHYNHVQINLKVTTLNLTILPEPFLTLMAAKWDLERNIHLLCYE